MGSVVRGGNHAANRPETVGLPPNPSGSTVEPKMQIWSIAASGGTPRLLGDGEHEPCVAGPPPVVHVARDRQVGVLVEAPVVRMLEHVAEEAHVLRPGLADHDLRSSWANWTRLPSGS